MDKNEIIRDLPYGEDFLFVDEILDIDENGVRGTYTFKKNLQFYNSHFKDRPVTPAVMLTETMAQIGLVCLGIFLAKESFKEGKISLAMTSNQLEFMKPVYPGEKIWVTSHKIFFRFNKLSCQVKMENSNGEIVSKGNIAGMLITKTDG